MCVPCQINVECRNHGAIRVLGDYRHVTHILCEKTSHGGVGSWRVDPIDRVHLLDE